MMTSTMKRRTILQSLAAGTLAAASGAPAVSLAGLNSKTAPARVRYCLNTSTIRGQQVGIEREAEIAAEAGYDGIEPWIRSVRSFTEAGGRLSDLRSRISDLGLTIDSAIGFASWIADDEQQRSEGLQQAARDMELLAELGASRIAAPPAGAQNGPAIELSVIAERYRKLLELGDQTGVVPQLEVWGFSRNLARLGDAVAVCVEADHPSACLLPDVYHIFKGGSGFGGLSLLDDNAVHVFHMNDYPAEPSREEMNDGHRVYPGDGIAPLDEILQSIAGGNRTVTLSLELFNKSYWEQDPLEVARTGLQKMQAAVQAAGLS